LHEWNSLANEVRPSPRRSALHRRGPLLHRQVRSFIPPEAQRMLAPRFSAGRPAQKDSQPRRGGTNSRLRPSVSKRVYCSPKTQRKGTKCQAASLLLAESLKGNARSVSKRVYCLLKDSKERHEVSGHEFTRAEKARNKNGALAPEWRFSESVAELTGGNNRDYGRSPFRRPA